MVRAGGEAIIFAQVNSQTGKDLLFMEALAIPLSFVVLVWVFGGLLAAALPMAVGGFAILGSMAVLRTISLFTEVSIYALNLTVALGMALLMSISFAALMAAQVTIMRMFGLGLTVAVLMDATLVRMLLVPAFMRVLGRANWWAPKPLARLHGRFGLSETTEPPTVDPHRVGRG